MLVQFLATAIAMAPQCSSYTHIERDGCFMLQAVGGWCNINSNEGWKQLVIGGEQTGALGHVLIENILSLPEIATPLWLFPTTCLYPPFLPRGPFPFPGPLPAHLYFPFPSIL